ncbi:hypothetical protein LCAZH_p030 (plasmid) [Lacticaseibacillus paracasei]|nr:hypothetical protein LCAZH_p030 [Lacticaseibacillus paracasei]
MLQNYLNSNILKHYSYIIYLFFRLKHIQLEAIGLLFIT